jgi:hypothetical protein
MKVILSTGQYCLPRLHEIVARVTTASIMAVHAVPKKNQSKKIHMTEPLHSLKIDTNGSYLLSGFKIYFLPKQANFFKYKAHYLS